MIAVLASLPLKAVSPGAPVLEYEMPALAPENYETSVERLMQEFERQGGREIAPGERRKVGLKVYTNSGPGLATPVPLVRAVIRSLEQRGYAKEEIFLIDLNELRLRRSGFLPPLSEGGETFEGHPVYVLESGRYFDPAWHYDSPLPPRREPGLGGLRREVTFEQQEEDRHSLLPVPLLREVDFWINLPVYTDHQVLGLNGALVNATLWNASNTLRFFGSEANGPAAVAEMAAVPELSERWLFTLVSRERYQFAGGPSFHSLYTASEPVLMLSADPVALDAVMFQRINERREATRFKPLEEDLPQLDYASLLHLGQPHGRVERVGEEREAEQ